jgi:glycosyltransferase involved in cell wall biosynthesis
MPVPITVTVVIPAYNHGHFVAEAIQSVLLQDYAPIETIVVDDGSTDDTAAVVAGFPAVRYQRQENRGLAAARNAGLAIARGELIVFLDADDRLLPGAISTGAAILIANPALGFTAGYSQFITREGEAQPTMQPVRGAGDAYLALLRRNSIRNPAMVMFRRDILQRAGPFASGVDACADYELYLRISREHPVAFHDAVVAEYRKHGANMSDNASLMLRQLLEVMRRQRPHLRSPEREQAFREGLANIRSYYGNRIMSQMRRRVRSGAGWRRSMEDVATLAWCHPAGLAEHAARKLRLWHRGRGPDGGPPPYDLNDSAKD